MTPECSRITWHETLQRGSAKGREFTLPPSASNQRRVTGILWSGPDSAPGHPLICLGHGASGDRHQRPIPLLAERLTTGHGCFCLAIDGPVHGRRQVGAGGREAFWPEWRREGTAEDMVGDWRTTLRAVSAEPDVGSGPVGYWGLSMGTIYGVPFVAEEPRMSAAVLGLMGITEEPGHYRPVLVESARAVRCPVLFMWQLEDKIFPREACLALFDTLGTDDKRLHANPGLHPQVPLEELDASIAFLTGALTGTHRSRDPLFRISE